MFRGHLHSVPCQITASASRLISYHYKLKILISPCLPSSWHNIQNPSTSDQFFFLINLRFARKINARTLNTASVTVQVLGKSVSPDHIGSFLSSWIYYRTGEQTFQKSRSHRKILGTIRVTRNKVPCWGTINLVATANWGPRIVHPCATISYFSQQTPPIVIHAEDPQILSSLRPGAPEMCTHVLQYPISHSKTHLLSSTLRIHKFSRHGDLEPQKCAPMCCNILFLTAKPTYCHPCWGSINLVDTATWNPRNVHPCATASYFSQQTPPIVTHNTTSVYPSVSGLFRPLCTEFHINRRNDVSNTNVLILKETDRREELPEFHS